MEINFQTRTNCTPKTDGMALDLAKRVKSAIRLGIYRALHTGECSIIRAGASGGTQLPLPICSAADGSFRRNLHI